MDMKYYTPKVFDKQKLDATGFSIISKHYFQTAKHLVLEAEKETKKKDFKVSAHILSSIILFTLTLECYFNENLALSYVLTSNEKIKYEIDLLKHSKRSKESDSPNAIKDLDFKGKVKAIFILYDKNSIGIDTNSSLYRDFISLVDLRNDLVHYKPSMDSLYDYPEKTRAILNKGMFKLINSDWTSNISNIAIGKWAYETVKNIIIEFSNISGGFNPFDSWHKHLLWE